MSTRVLVVDDDRATCEIVSRLLSKEGYAVDVACSGNQALELLEGNNYRLAVLDYRMPDMTGAELFRQARQIQPDLQAVFLTAYTTIDTVFPAIDAGAFRVLGKPVSAPELIPLVHGLAGRDGAS